MSFHQRFTDLKNRLLKGRHPVRPIFLMSYGPMGSGKSSRVSDLIKDQGMDPGEFVPLLLDTIIETDPEYQTECKKVVSQEKLSREERATLLQNVYFRFRKDSAVISEALLSLVVRSRLNVIFESTGSDLSLRWALYMLRRMGEVGYETWIFYPYVVTSKLKERCEIRAMTTHRWIPLSAVDNHARMAQANFPVLAGHADKVWIVDNNGPKDEKYRNVYRVVNTDDVDHGMEQRRCFADKELICELDMDPSLLKFLKSMQKIGDHEKKFIANGAKSPVGRLTSSGDGEVVPIVDYRPSKLGASALAFDNESRNDDDGDISNNDDDASKNKDVESSNPGCDIHNSISNGTEFDCFSRAQVVAETQ